MNVSMRAARCASRFAGLVCALLVFAASPALGQTLIVYDDELRNQFQNFSFPNPPIGVADFASPDQAHGGMKSIRFVGHNFGGVSFARGDFPDVSTAQFPVLRFWLHGGAAGGQELSVNLQLNGVAIPAGGVDVDAYITGGAIAAGQWREVTINLTQPPFNAATFDRIDIQSQFDGTQPELFIDDVVLGQATAEMFLPMLIQRNEEVAGMLTERFTWRDSSNQRRSAALAYNDGQVGPQGGTGGSLRQFEYQLPNGATRTAKLTGYGVGDAGFGYIVMHASRSQCLAVDSPLGGLLPQAGFERIFEGRHHAILRFKQNYQRNCAVTNPIFRTIPVTIDWIFSTGRDHPVWAVTYDIDQASPNPGPNIFYDDSRAPYGELAIDGDGFSFINGVGWGDRFKFTSKNAVGTAVTLDSPWTWNVPNTVPYIKEWLDGPLEGPFNKRDATMGIVQTQTIDQQDAGGGRDAIGSADLRPFWNTTSQPNVKICNNAGRVHAFPCANDWPYQANANSLDFEFGQAMGPAGSVNARMTWKTQYGFVGQELYATNNNGPVANAPGYPKKSYSTYIVLGTHTNAPVEEQVSQVETVQSVSFFTRTGTVRLSGPAGIKRADNVQYDPPGYNHVYGALALDAAGNALDADINVGAGMLKKPLVIISNYTGGTPAVKIGGAAAIADVDYFASLRPSAGELWITLNRTLAGAGNRLEIQGSVAPACNPSLNPPSAMFAAGGGPGTVAVTTACAWTAVSNSSFITVTAGSAGEGNGTVNYTIAPKTTAGSRTGTITVAGLLFTVTQTGAVGTVNAVKGDFDGDGKADIIFRNGSSGANQIFFLDGVTLRLAANIPPIADTAWDLEAVADMTGDGQSDIIWRNYVSGSNYLWIMNGPVLVDAIPIPPIADTAWDVAAVADFDGDRRPDILWRNYVSGSNYVWLMDGATLLQSAPLPLLPTSWACKGAADMSADGKADVIWRNSANGANLVWLMNGATIGTSANIFAVADTAWDIKGLADVDGDTRADLVWRNYASGSNYLWFMSGTTVLDTVPFPPIPDTAWDIRAIGDFDGNGLADIGWRNFAGGANYVWLMNGTTVTNSAPLPGFADLNWDMRGPR